MRLDARIWLALLVCALAAPICVRAQAKDHWQRVYTGDDSIIEFNTSSSRFEAGSILRAGFRTTFTKAESVGGGAKYKTRLETIDFSLRDRRYRFFEISLLDPNGKLIQTKKTDGSEDWRIIKPGGITERLFNAVCFVIPLGSWKVVTYRFAEGGPKKVSSTPELDKLIGVRVNLYVDRAQVGEKICRSPSFEDKGPAQQEFLKELGIEWQAIGVKPGFARTITVKCDGSGWHPPQSLVISENNKEELLMLWDGVFLVLKRASASDSPRTAGRPTIKRR